MLTLRVAQHCAQIGARTMTGPCNQMNCVSGRERIPKKPADCASAPNLNGESFFNIETDLTPFQSTWSSGPFRRACPGGTRNVKYLINQQKTYFDYLTSYISHTKNKGTRSHPLRARARENLTHLVGQYDDFSFVTSDRFSHRKDFSTLGQSPISYIRTQKQNATTTTFHA